MVTARKPSSHHRGPPSGKKKAAGQQKLHVPPKRMRQMLKKMPQGGQEVDRAAVLKAAFPRGSSGSWAASAAGREAMPGTVPGDWNRNLHYRDVLLDDGLKHLRSAGVTGVSTGRTFPAPELAGAHQPGSHRRGTPRGKNTATGHRKPHEPSKISQQMPKEMLQGGQEVDRAAVLKAAFPRGSSGSWAASAAGREAMLQVVLM
ncbi:uncharacterized protein LOC111935344 [Cyanistes caeruleus]|uniref:uncharacterized protein LOC111935344 n=1 Tax=Cyanistes caeruleus TaxID=156563 RepID=UPI000CDAFF44|nr:uncharacterized protein LOC111935344 [Cyanistes caeruleus]